MVVPAQRGDAVALVQAQLLQRSAQGARAAVVLAVAVAAQALVGQAADDFVAGEIAAGPVQQVVGKRLATPS
jgi:hypothetical protein